MNRVTLSCLAAVALAGAAGTAFATMASAEDCYGLNAARVCATVHPGRPPRLVQGDPIEECVHVGGTCQPVSVPRPGVMPGTGPDVETGCYIGSQTCGAFLSGIVTTSGPDAS